MSSQVSASISPSASPASRQSAASFAAAAARSRRSVRRSAAAHSSKLPERASKPSSSGSAASLRAAFSDSTVASASRARSCVHVHLDLREVERDLLRVRLDERVQFRRQRAAQRRQRLAQARARELRVGVFPEQRGEALAALRRAVLQREEGEQGAGLAGA